MFYSFNIYVSLQDKNKFLEKSLDIFNRTLKKTSSKTYK